MEGARCQRLEELFDQALNLNPDQQRAFIEEACKEDEEMASELWSLLNADEGLGSFLEQPLIDPWLAGPSEVVQLPPDIGPFQLHHCLGEGGMGIVWLARQLEPVDRMVAIKVLKGQGGRNHVRFSAEYQALARLNHPHIAQIFEVGSDRGGRAYFTMEYLPGLSITKYAEQQNLTIRERIELVVQTCHGLEHAHQRGIIHRDIKPSNVLVTAESGRSQVKIIDFGIAKSINHLPLTPETLETQHGVLLGTPTHMSPEQTEGPNGEVDTRTDIYSLGTILYELLAGEPVFSNERFSQLSYDRMIMVIRHEFPLQPSQVVAKRLREQSHQGRKLRPDDKQWAQRLRGELDGIVARALAKEPDRRYPTMSAFAEDLTRYLQGKPVMAMPDRWTYRFWKLCQRHVLVAWLLIALFLSLAIGLVVSLGMTQKLRVALAKSERSQELVIQESKKQEAFALVLKKMVIQANPAYGNRDITVREAMEFIDEQGELEQIDSVIVKAGVSGMFADTFWRMGTISRALANYAHADQLFFEHYGGTNHESLRVRIHTAEIFLQEKNTEKASELLDFKPVERLLIQEESPNDYWRLNLLNIELTREERAPAISEAEYRDLINEQYRLPTLDRNLIVRARQGLAISMRNQGKYQQGLSVLRSLLKDQEADSGKEADIERGDTLGLIANIQRKLGDLEGGIETYGANLTVLETVYPENHYKVNESRKNLGLFFMDLGDHQLATDYFLHALVAKENNDLSKIMGLELGKYLGSLAYLQGNASLARTQFEALLTVWEEVKGTEHVAYLGREYLSTHYNLGYTLLLEGNYVKGLEELELNLCLQKEANPERVTDPGHVLLGIAQALWLLGDYERAHDRLGDYLQEIEENPKYSSYIKGLVKGYYGHTLALRGETDLGLRFLREGYEQSAFHTDLDPQWLIPALEHWHECL